MLIDFFAVTSLSELKLVNGRIAVSINLHNELFSVPVKQSKNNCLLNF